MKPLAIDIFCGLGGWTDGLLAEGFEVVGFDIERHVYGEHRYPAQLVLQDVLTIHGRQFKHADLIVASPPCQEFSYMAMPWSKAKQKIRDYESGVRDVTQLTALFDACFRIQREASEAKGEYIPLVVENVRGAQKWVGRARWHFGSFYLWGDVPALMPIAIARPKGPRAGTGNQLCAIRVDQIQDDGLKNPGFRFDGSGKSFQTASVEGVKVATMGAGWYPPDHPKHVPGLAFNGHAEKNYLEISKAWRDKHYDKTEKAEHQKNSGGSWFNIGSPGQKETGRNPVHELSGMKGAGDGWFNDAKRKGGTETGRLSQSGSKSPARKAASALIAKIPLVLSRHIAKAWKPEGTTLSEHDRRTNAAVCALREVSARMDRGLVADGRR